MGRDRSVTARDGQQETLGAASPRPARVRTVVAAVFGRPGGAVALALLSVVCGYLFACRGMRFFLVPSASMEPTLEGSDYIATVVEQVYHRGDIVVFEDPEEHGAYIVKRIVGVAGDTVAVLWGKLYLNGKRIVEPYVREPMEYALLPLTVPLGEVFLLGDNRNNSDDSHVWGQITQPVDMVVGKVVFIYSPVNRMGRVRSAPWVSIEAPKAP